MDHLADTLDGSSIINWIDPKATELYRLPLEDELPTMLVKDGKRYYSVMIAHTEKDEQVKSCLNELTLPNLFDFEIQII